MADQGLAIQIRIKGDSYIFFIPSQAPAANASIL
jgi:hypothetical protein